MREGATEKSKKERRGNSMKEMEGKGKREEGKKE